MCLLPLQYRGVWLVLLAAGTLGLYGQTFPAAVSEPSFANLPAQEVGVDDLIAVTVYGAPELSRTARVNSAGQIRLPMVKRPIQAEGLLPAQLEVEIAAALREEEILVAPVVTVAVAEYRSRPISVSGAVHRPLTFQATGTVTLLDALTRAEGITASAGSEILVSRKGPAGGPESVLVERIPVKELLDTADPRSNLRLLGGEEIRVPEAGKIYVVGHVRKPGAFAVPDPAATGVLQMLALSEGLLQYSDDRAYVYRADGGAAGKSELSIELKKIVERRAPDVALRANDVLYIPEKKGKRATMTALEKILIFGTAATAAAIYAGVR